MSRLILATENQGKAKEIRAILKDQYDEILTASEAGVDMSEIEEDADTFRGNAEKKALAVSERVAGDVLADDSGLEVHALGGAPGVWSARWAGEGASDDENNRKLIDQMRDVTDRTARFVCCMVIANNGAVKRVIEGHVDGEILDRPRGTGGFGYDSLFFFPEDGMTFAEIPTQRKNTVSHRARALEELKKAAAQHG